MTEQPDRWPALWFMLFVCAAAALFGLVSHYTVTAAEVGPVPATTVINDRGSLRASSPAADPKSEELTGASAVSLSSGSLSPTVPSSSNIVSSTTSASSSSAATATPSPTHSGPGRPKDDSSMRQRCGLKAHPWLPGSFDNSTAPYWRPDARQNCTIHGFSTEEAGRCLANRRIYVMGNSVGRGLFYELPLMLPAPPSDGVEHDPNEMILIGLDWIARGSAPDRLWQKEQCAKMRGEAGEVWGGSSCTTVIESVNASGSFLWKQWFFDTPEFVDRDEIAADYCSDRDSEACLADFFVGSTDRDFLAFNLGLMIAAQAERLRAHGLWYSRPRREGGSWPWLTQSIANFTAALARVTPIPRSHMAFANMHLILQDDSLNALTRDINEFAVPMLQAAGIPCVDQRTVNTGRSGLYADQVHFPGVLSRAFWHAALSEWCE